MRRRPLPSRRASAAGVEHATLRLCAPTATARTCSAEPSHGVSESRLFANPSAIVVLTPAARLASRRTSRSRSSASWARSRSRTARSRSGSACARTTPSGALRRRAGWQALAAPLRRCVAQPPLVASRYSVALHACVSAACRPVPWPSLRVRVTAPQLAALSTARDSCMPPSRAAATTPSAATGAARSWASEHAFPLAACAAKPQCCARRP